MTKFRKIFEKLTTKKHTFDIKDEDQRFMDDIFAAVIKLEKKLSTAERFNSGNVGISWENIDVKLIFLQMIHALKIIEKSIQFIYPSMH